MKQKSAIFGFILLCFLGCVDVEDVLSPIIFVDNDNGNIVSDTLYYQDTLKFTVNFQDNVSIDTSIVAITRLGADISDSINNWVIFITERDTLRGSRFVTREINQLVPATLPYSPNDYTPVDKYVISLFAIDKAKGVRTFQDTFYLCDDITPPEFHELSLDLETVDDTLFTCPGFTIPISGGASDNTQFRRYGYSFNGGLERSIDANSSNMEFDSLDLTTLFTGPRSVSIPDTLNNQTVSLTIFAEDFFRNKIEQTFLINVDCDTKGPEIRIVSTTPTISDENEVSVVTDTQFSLDSIVVTDSSAIGLIEIYFGQTGGATLYKSYTFPDPPKEVNLGSIDQLLFPDPLNVFTQVGLTYDLTIKAYDTVTFFSPNGNESENISINLIIKQDDPVNIASLDLILNEGDASSQTFKNADTTSVYTISIADDLSSDPNFINRIIPDGKAEDDVGITNITMEWILPDNQVITVADQDFDPTEVVIKLRDFHDNQLIFDSEMQGTYVLQISLSDVKRTQTFKYTFELVD